MSVLLPLILKKARRTADEEIEQLKRDQLRFGYHFQGLGKLNGGKGWLDYYATWEHCSYSSMASLFTGSFAVNALDSESWERCEQLFRQYSACLEEQAIRHNYDPLSADSMSVTPGGVKNCYVFQDSMFKVCGESQAQNFCDGRRRELFWARIRRQWILATKELKEDFNWKPYPDWVFSTAELKSLYGASHTGSIADKIREGRYSDIFTGTIQESHEIRIDTFTEIAGLKEEMWPASSISGSQRAYMEYKREKDAIRETDMDVRQPMEQDKFNQGPKQNIVGAALIGQFSKNKDLSYLAVDPELRKYLETDPKVKASSKKHESATAVKIF